MPAKKVRQIAAFIFQVKNIKICPETRAQKRWTRIVGLISPNCISCACAAWRKRNWGGEIASYTSDVLISLNSWEREHHCHQLYSLRHLSTLKMCKLNCSFVRSLAVCICINLMPFPLKADARREQHTANGNLVRLGAFRSSANRFISFRALCAAVKNAKRNKRNVFILCLANARKRKRVRNTRNYYAERTCGNF